MQTSAPSHAPLLTRAECAALRGIAIIAIVMHNYCHWLGPIVKENEYRFFSRNVEGLSRVLLHPDALLPVHLFSFFGHYGVPVFLFLSAYGLEQKYATARADSVTAFVRAHFGKLFTMMVAGFAAFTLLDHITPGTHHYAFVDIVAQLVMVNNLLPHPDDIIWPGPYWFFGLMLQLYVVYRLLLYRRSWHYTVALMAVCWLLQIFCDPEGELLNRLRYNFIGGMLPFGLGLLYARHGRLLSQPANVTLLVLSALLTVVGSYSYRLWFFVPAFVCVCSVALVKLPARCPRLFNHFVWVGGFSAALFVCHPLVRKVFIPVSRHGDVYAGLSLYVVGSICVALLFRELLRVVSSSKR